MNSKKTTKETVEQAIFFAIANGEYPQNSILTERELVDKYQVSRTPVREALIELCKDNIIRSLPRLGYQVVPITLKEVLDIIYFRIDLEEANMRRAFPDLTLKQLNDLRELALVPSSEAPKLSTEWDENQMFHLKLCATSNNQYTYTVLQSVLRQSVIYIAKFCNSQLKMRAKRQTNYHLNIINYLEKRDLENAILELRKDILVIIDDLLETYPELKVNTGELSYNTHSQPEEQAHH